jgi:hypothetical protein
MCLLLQPHSCHDMMAENGWRAVVVQLWSLRNKVLFASYPLVYEIHAINIKDFSSYLTQNSLRVHYKYQLLML